MAFQHFYITDFVFFQAFDSNWEELLANWAKDCGLCIGYEKTEVSGWIFLC